MNGGTPTNPDGAITPDIPLGPPRAQSPGHVIHNVEQRLAELQVGQSELHLTLAHLTKAIDNAKLPELAAKVDQLVKGVDGAKLPELGFKIDSLIRAVENAKLPELTIKVDNLSKSVESTKGKVDDLMTTRSMVIGGFGVLVFVVTVVGGLITWAIKGLSDNFVVQPKPAQLIAAQPPATPTPVAEPLPHPVAPASTGSAQQPAPTGHKP